MQAFFKLHEQLGDWSHLPAAEELLANLMDDAYLRGKREERDALADIELSAVQSELESLKGPFIQLMKRLRLVDGGDDPESPLVWVRGRVRMLLWQQLRNLYEATLPPVDHSWLDSVNGDEK
jgi:hypothetical protein